MRFSGGVALLSCMTMIACGGGGHGFLRDKTGVEISRDVRICTNGTGGNDASCKPTDTGGPAWVKAENFDIFSMGVPDDRGDETAREAAHRYLATPYWAGSLKLACKREFSVSQFPAEISISSEQIDLAQVLEQETARTFEVEAFARLKAPVAPEIRVEFHRRMAELIRSKVQVKLLWFVARFTGGRYAIGRHESLTACRNEVEAHAHEGAQMVTGVAGFAVLTNRADTAITDRQQVEWALNALVKDTGRFYDDGVGASWNKTVSKVLTVQWTATQVHPTVYPLWVQFE
jgi:hypothetical protein